MSTSQDDPTLTVMLVPEGSRETRTIQISYRRLRTLAMIAGAVALALTLMVGSWWYLAARAARTSELEERVEVMTRDQARVQELVERLQTIENQYGAIRSLFGSSDAEQPSGVWLPPVAVEREGDGRERPLLGESVPAAWPLAERGFVTQGVHGGGVGGDHPGLDIAVASDSYIRASGAGTVTDVGEDAVYGRFVVIDHGDGYSTLYGHASTTFVEKGQRVRERQVIALSGSTGRSTGPHLHFEVLVDGEPVDPLTLVDQPG
jgi:murein DD-endopeptidase MepM/ murein hydrolase activator NlpD